jgi:thioesterase domain-containing protein
MDARISALFGRREQRLQLMDALARALEDGQPAILGSDPEAIERNASIQRAIVEELRALDARSFTHTAHAALHELLPEHDMSKESSANPSAEERWAAMTRELQAIEKRVQHLALLHAALIKRVRRTADIMSRILLSAALTYVPPQPEISTQMEG